MDHITYKYGEIVSRILYNDSGQVMSKGSFKNGKLHGPVIDYDKYYNGYHRNFKDGLQHSITKVYYSLGHQHSFGQLKLELNYKDGVRDGFIRSYYENGNLTSKGYFKNGKEDGLWEYFNEDGSIKKLKFGKME